MSNEKNYFFPVISQREIVKFSNQFNTLDLSDFTIVERRFLMIFLYICKDRKPKEEIIMNRQDFINLGVYKPGTKIGLETFADDLESTLDKCSRLRFHKIDKWSGRRVKAGKYVPLFEEISYDFTGEWKVIFSVSTKALPYVSELLNEFTRFPLREFQSLDSRYLQDLYRILKQFRMTGWWKVSKSDFLILLNVPKSYRESTIDTRIIGPALKELSRFFPNLRCQKRYEKIGRSRRVSGYKFTWDSDEGEYDDIYKAYLPGTVLHEFEIEFGRSFTQEEEEDILDLEKLYGRVAVLLALDEAAVWDKRYLEFIEETLAAWKRKGLSNEDLQRGKR